jgi:DNA-binding MarR family transcriptional regulator
MNTLLAGGAEQRPLTGRQSRILGFVEEHIRRSGYPPTLREIGDAVGLANINAVRGHLDALQRKGYVTKEPDKARSICVVRSPSPLGLLKRKLHEVFQTDRDTFHRIVYGLAWKTPRGAPYLAGAARRIEDALEAEAVERGWRIVERRIQPDHVVVIVEAWPNHSPRLALERLQDACRRAIKRRPRGEVAGGRLWARGFVATTDLAILDELVRRLLAGPAAGKEATP